MSSRTRRTLTLLLVALVVLGGLPAAASAQQFGPGSDGAFGDVVRIDAGETYDGDLEAAAGSVVVAGTVDGDLEAAAGSVIITETGEVTGSLDAAAGSVVIEGSVVGDVNVGSAALELREGSQIGGSLEAGAADVRLAGAVDGDVTVGADTLTVAPTATIGGSLTYDAGQFTLADGATVAGEVTRDESLVVAGPEIFGAGGGAGLPTIPAWIGAVYGALANLVLGAVLLVVAPNFARRLVDVGQTETLRSGGIGLLALIGTPIVLLLLLLTIVGIPISLAGIVAFALLLWVASVYGSIVLGTWLVSLLDAENRWLALLVGVLVVALLGAVPILGGLVQLAVLLVGLGAFVIAVRGVRREPDEETGAPVGGPTAAE
ncbi:polymer-forming cytoskeletal protein [Halobellus sp. Atlit-31R]|nr:polymer-forming cytoskeletal protein [Halobellus sp. Atlit-31R]